jgi:rhamnosyltransferase
MAMEERPVAAVGQKNGSGSADAPAADNVVAVIVTLRPDADVVGHVHTLTELGLRTVVVDNGSGPDGATLLDSIAGPPSVEVIRNATNRGIAAALNQGARFAMESGAAWLLTMDQDAAPSPEILRIAAETFGAYPAKDRIAVIGSASVADAARTRAARVRGADAGRSWSDVRWAITAGSFVSLAAFRAVGEFRDDLFVDYVDIEFCLRARRSGYRILMSAAPAMTHEVGAPALRRLGPRTVAPTHHSAVRRYYITRNRLIVWRSYLRTEPRFVARDILASQKELLKLLLFETDRPAKLRAILAGLRDGSRGVTGERRARR